MRRCALPIVLTMGLMLWALAEEPNPPTTRTQNPTFTSTDPPTAGVLKFPHLRIDLKSRRISLDAELCHPAYVLEFLLCKWNTKEYESLLRTKVQPAHLHAALLSLGLRQGKPARWSHRGESAIFSPPQGAELKIAFRWTDARGEHQVDAAQWLTNPAGKIKKPPTKWIFVGSDILPDGRYWGDLPEEGGIISVGNVPSSVIDVPFESGTAMELREFIPDETAVPKPGTPVEVIITPAAGAHKAEHARVLLHVDRFGEMRVEGRCVQPDELSEWARKYLTSHPKGQVVIRLDARALVDDLRVARDVLETAGVEEIEEVHLPPQAPMLPRSPEQAKRSLDFWEKRLSTPRDFLIDPAVHVDDILKEIDRRIGELKAFQAMWSEYAAHLRDALEEHTPTTRPAKDAPSPGAPRGDVSTEGKQVNE